jgi:hypothetical protein
MGNAFCFFGVGSGGTGTADPSLRGFGRSFGPGFGTLFGLDDFFMVGILITAGGGVLLSKDRIVSTPAQSMAIGFPRISLGKRIRVFNFISHIYFHRNSPIFPRYSIGSAPFSSHDQQYDTGHECNGAGDRRYRKRVRFLHHHIQWTGIDDIFSARVCHPKIPTDRDCYAKHYDGENCVCSHLVLPF